MLFKSSFRTLWLVAFGVVQDAALADDVVQDAAVIGLGKLKEFRAGSNFSAWMGKIVQYVALNQARAKRRRSTVPMDASTPAPVGPAAPAAVGDRLTLLAQGGLGADQQVFDDRVVAALNRVAHTPRICLLLRTIEGLDYAEIARLLRIPEGTAMSHVHRTRKFLRQELADLRPAGTDPGRLDA